MVVAFYFSKRLYEERHPNGDINQKVKALEEEVKEIPKTPLVPAGPGRPPLLPGQVVVKPSILS